MISIAVDAMGGDQAPDEIIKGAILAIQEYPITIFLVGPKDILGPKLEAIPPKTKGTIKICHASEVVQMCESPTNSFRKKKDSSIRVGLELVKAKTVQGFVSAGNTGAVMTAAVLVLGRLPKVERPAIASILPSVNGHFVMLDMGASMDCKANHLKQFAVMGKYFSQLVLGHKQPKVGLLNVGEEKSKGNSVVQETNKLLEKSSLDFVGNVEGRDILFGKADVVVCDGFVGNNLLKFGEGIAELFFNFFKLEAKSSVLSLIGLILLKPGLKRFKKKCDYSEYGGAPLLGVNGVVVIAHGKSDDNAIKNAIRTAVISAESNIISNITEAIKK